MPGSCSGSEELRAFLLKRVQRPEAVQFPQNVLSRSIDIAGDIAVLERLVEILNNKVLRVCLREAVEVNEEVVPGLLEVIAVLKSLKGEEGSTPGES